MRYLLVPILFIIAIVSCSDDRPDFLVCECILTKVYDNYFVDKKTGDNRGSYPRSIILVYRYVNNGNNDVIIPISNTIPKSKYKSVIKARLNGKSIEKRIGIDSGSLKVAAGDSADISIILYPDYAIINRNKHILNIREIIDQTKITHCINLNDINKCKETDMVRLIFNNNTNYHYEPRKEEKGIIYPNYLFF